MFEKIKKLLAKKSKKENCDSKSIQAVHGQYDNPRSAGWNGVGTAPRGVKHPGNIPF